MDAEFVKTVQAARKSLALKHLLGATLIAALYAAYGFIADDVSDPLVLTFRINNALSMMFLLLTLMASYFSTAFVHHLDIPMAMICAHIIAYNSLTYSRLQVLTSPVFDHISVESDASEEIECVLLGYMCVSVLCHFNIVDVKAALGIAILAPLCWSIQVALLGTSLSNVRTVAMLYWTLSCIAFFGLRRHQANLLLLEWETYGFGKRGQQEATCGIMDFMCDCVVNLSSAFVVLEDCPKLSTLLLRMNLPSLIGEDFTNFLASPSDIAILEQHMEAGPEVGMFLICLKDVSNRHLQCHAYFSRFQDELDRTCYVLGLLEKQETETTRGVPVLFADPDATPDDITRSESGSEPDEVAIPTLSEVLSSSDADGMSFLIHPGAMKIVESSEMLNQFTGSSMAGLTVKLTARTKPAFQGRVNQIQAKLSHIDMSFGELELQLPDGLPERDRGSDRTLHIQNCSLDQIIFTKLDGESHLLLEISMLGKKELRRKWRKAARMIGRSSVSL